MPLLYGKIVGDDFVSDRSGNVADMLTLCKSRGLKMYLRFDYSEYFIALVENIRQHNVLATSREFVEGDI